MTAPAFEAWHRVRVHAVLVGTRIDLKAMQRSDRLAPSPLAIPAGERGWAVLFRYGAVVLFNLQVVEEAAFLKSLSSFIDDPLDPFENEETEIHIGVDGEERADANGIIRLHVGTEERMLVVADVLAKSVVLAYDENRVGRVFDRIEPVAQGLRRAEQGSLPMPHLLDLIGDVLLTQHRTVGRVEVTEKPELLWDHPELERLYLRLQEEYELPDRDRALTRKLNLITQTATTSLGLLEYKQSLRVEWYIVILIVVEIVLTLYELFFARHG